MSGAHAASQRGAAAEPSDRGGTTFYCVTGRDFFLGAVALLNSLRLAGHDEPLVVLDCGMDRSQRDLLRGHAEVLPAPAELAPSMLKLAAPLARPSEVMVLLDADLVVTRPLFDLIESAAEGRVVAFANDRQRYFAEWRTLLGVDVRRTGPYLSSSAVFLGGRVGVEVASEAHERQSGLDVASTWIGQGTEEDPLFYADQDVLNAVILSLPAERVVALDQRLAGIPPFTGLSLVDAAAPRCRYGDGLEPYLVHHLYRKPWLVRMRSNLYSKLMTRLLVAEDLPLRVDDAAVPLRLRRGPAAVAARAAVDVLYGVPSSVKRHLSRPPRDAHAWPNRARPETERGGGRGTA